MTLPVHPLGFKTENLPLDQLRALADALTTIGNVASAMQEWPVFFQDGNYTEAGRMVEGLRVKVFGELDTIRSDVEARAVTTKEEAEAKFDILMAGMTWSGDHIPTVVAKLANLAAELDWQVTCATRAAA